MPRGNIVFLRYYEGSIKRFGFISGQAGVKVMTKYQLSYTICSKAPRLIKFVSELLKEELNAISIQQLIQDATAETENFCATISVEITRNI